jgi:hypothetical protein
LKIEIEHCLDFFTSVVLFPLSERKNWWVGESQEVYIGPSLTLVLKHQSISSDPSPVFSKIGKPVLTFPPMDFKYQNWF